MLANFLNNVGGAFNLTVMGLVLVVIGSATEENSRMRAAVASAGMAGAVSGQLIMGFLGDCMGRLRALGLTTVIVLVGSLLSAALPQGDNTLFTLAVCRFFTGFGVGGIYPLTAVAAAEAKGSKGVVSTLLVFSGQGWGQLLAPLTVYLLFKANAPPETIWRGTLILAAIPTMLALFLMGRDMRRRMRANELEAIDAIREVAGEHPSNVALRAEQDRRAEQEFSAMNPEPQSFRKAFFNAKNLRKLLGTGGTWFIFDVTFYANVIFAPVVLGKVFELNSSSTVGDIAGPTCVVILIGLPGYYVASAVVNRTGLKRLQMAGFIILAILYGIMAIGADVLPPGFLFTLYAATFFVSNLGPNSTTFCLPAKTFPKSTRSSFNGISAAMGKLGAVVGTAMFPAILDSSGMVGALGFSSFVALAGAVLTHFTVESEFIPQAQRLRRGSNDTFVGFIEMGAPGFQDTSLQTASNPPPDAPAPKRLPFASMNNVAYLSRDENPFAAAHSSYERINETSDLTALKGL